MFLAMERHCLAILTGHDQSLRSHAVIHTSASNCDFGVLSAEWCNVGEKSLPKYIQIYTNYSFQSYLLRFLKANVEEEVPPQLSWNQWHL